MQDKHNFDQARATLAKPGDVVRVFGRGQKLFLVTHTENGVARLKEKTGGAWAAGVCLGDVSVVTRASGVRNS
jgi:hypothetical protein